MEKRNKKQEELILEAKKFFDAYKKEVAEATRKGENVLRLSFPQLAEYSLGLAENTIDKPEETLAILETALEEGAYLEKPRVRLLDLPKSAYVKVREIRAKHLDQLLWIEGIVRQASDVRPQVVNAKFECPNCGAILSVLQLDKKFREPSRCSCGWKGTFKLLSKEMVDAQRLVIEESPDSLEGGEQPRRINVLLREDLVDPKMEERVAPGNRVKVFGILKEVPVPLQTGAISTRFDIAVEANNLIPTEESYEELEITEEDERQIKELAADSNVFRRMAQSVAPSIYGFDRIKEAVLLQLFGGVKKKKSDSGDTRGDIHVLLVGDPGVAKSVLLKYVSTIAPKGRYVSGKAATAAGLCVSPRSRILTNPGGIEEIGDVVEGRIGEEDVYCEDVWRKKEISDLKIQSLSNDLKIHTRNPEAIWKLKAPEKVFEVVLSSGKRVELTGNTQLYILEKGVGAWKKSSEIREGDFIATPRKLIGGKNEKVYIADLINSNPVVYGIKDFVKIIAEKLSLKYGGIRKAAKELAINENKLYHNWVNEKARGNIKLRDLKRISDEAGIDWKEKVKEVSLYNGKRHKMPLFLDGDLLYLAGIIAGDGDIRKANSDTYTVRFSNSNRELQGIFSKIVSEKFGLRFDIQERNETRPEARRVNCKLLGEMLISLGIPISPKSTRIFMSNELLHLSNKLFAEYIAGLYDTDGSIYVRKEGKVGSDCIDFTSCSERLVRELQLALLRFGIHSVLRRREPSKGRIRGRHERFVLEVRSNEDIRRFGENIKLRHPEKKRKINEIMSKARGYSTNLDVLPGTGEVLKKILKENKTSLRKIKWHKNLSRRGLQNLLERISIHDERLGKLKTLAYSDIFWEKVENVNEKVPDYEFVYDLTVEDSHNFVVDGILVHNTAAVVKDEFLRGWALEAGAMVLANKGTVCIDEIEKMNEQDRSTMHESMEQQTVTISKANIHASLRAETTVLAAGNPKMGRFDPYTPIPQQIDISPALLSRFDVIFVIRDLPNKSQDEAIATHVLEEHKQEVERDVLDAKFMRKYIAYAKQRFRPKLTDEAIDEIKDFYITLRNQSIKAESDIKPIPITPRQLEGIIRLAEAHAKLRLSERVTKEDAKIAIKLLKVSLTQVGYDEETKTFDIDRITTGITSSKRSKIIMVREVISQLENQLGKLIPMEDLQKALGDRVSEVELEEALNQLSKSGDIFKPKKGFIQKI